LRAVADEWRVEVDLGDEAHPAGMAERLQSLTLDDAARKRLGDRVIVTHDGPHLFMYAASEATAREAEAVVREQIEADGELTAQIAVTRWHPLAEQWKDASEPLPTTEEERAAEIAEHEAAELAEVEQEGRYDWEVQVGHVSREHRAQLAEQLQADGHPVKRRFAHLTIGALTEERAEEIAAWVREQSPGDTSVEIVPVIDEPTPGFTWLGF
jgi:hypothetical protein